MRKYSAGLPQIGSPSTVMRALARFELAGHQLHERGLAGAVRTEQAGDAGRDRERHVVETDHLAVPLRQMFRGDDGVHQAITSTPRTRRSRMKAETATSATIIRSDTGQGVEKRSGTLNITSPI